MGGETVFLPIASKYRKLGKPFKCTVSFKRKLKMLFHFSVQMVLWVSYVLLANIEGLK